MPSQLSRSLSPLPPQQDGLATQDHSTAGQLCQAKSSGLHAFGFPLRIIPHGFEKHQGPRPPLEAYQETQRWIEWDRDPDDPDDAGLWTYDWLKKPTPDDVSLLVEEMVLQRILPGCFSGDGGDQEAATARTDPFNSGDHKELYTLRCRCCPTSQEKQAAFAGLSPRDLSRPSSGIESQRPLNSSSPLTPSGCCSTLLHHDGSGDGKDSCNGSHIPGEVLLRPSLPLDPYSHMESDVAIAHAIEVRGVPVPRIYAYDSSAINFLGIEWQIVENISEPVADLLDQIISEEHKVLWAYGRPPAGIGTGRSAAWTRLGRQLEETLALSRSEENRSYRGQSSGACFDKMGSLYWDFEKHDFFLGPVTERYFTSGRRILYQQRHDYSTSSNQSRQRTASAMPSLLQGAPIYTTRQTSLSIWATHPAPAVPHGAREELPPRSPPRKCRRGSYRGAVTTVPGAALLLSRAQAAAVAAAATSMWSGGQILIYSRERSPRGN